MEMSPFFQFLDPYLIWFFRLSGHGFADFLLGTLVLACLSLLLGGVSSFLASLAVKKPFTAAMAEAAKYQRLSMEALAEGDRQTYKAANRLANEAFGKSFFMQVGLSAAYLWPIFFVLAWMNYRFAGVEFLPLPFTDRSLGFIGVFLLVYIPAYLLWRRLRRLAAAPVAALRSGPAGAGPASRGCGQLPVL